MCAAKTENLQLCNPINSNNDSATVAYLHERIKPNMRTRQMSIISNAEELEFSGRTICIQNHSYEYRDTIENLLGSGSYGTVFYGMDLRLHRKHSIYNNTTVGSSTTKTVAAKYDNNNGTIIEGVPTSAENYGTNAAQSYDASASNCGTSSYGSNPSSSKSSAGTFCAPRAVAIKQVARTSLKPNELRAMKRVRHPNLVRLIDICDADDTSMTDNENCDHEKSLFTYLIMEVCDIDLDRHLRNRTSNGRLEANDLKRVIESIACGYLALYEKRIVHRDIKPQNILLVYEGGATAGGSGASIASAKITDFGMSRIYDAVDAESADGEAFEALSNVAGTFYYMAPEVGANLLRVSEYDHSADMWSIGCVIYQCLTGQIPFDESAMCRLFLHCAGGNYEAYDAPDIPDEVADARTNALIARLLEIDREKRASPQELYVHAVANAADATGGGAADAPADAYIPPNLSFASLSSVLSSSTLDNSSTATMLSSSEGDEMFSSKHC